MAPHDLGTDWMEPCEYWLYTDAVAAGVIGVLEQLGDTLVVAAALLKAGLFGGETGRMTESTEEAEDRSSEVADGDEAEPAVRGRTEGLMAAVLCSGVASNSIFV